MGKYFGKEPRYSREEAEAQAKQAIDALVSRGRPPADEWKGLAGRMGEINRELATRPPVDLPSPPAPRRAEPVDGDGMQSRRRDLSQLLRPRPVTEPEPAPAAEAPHAAPPVPAPAPAKRAPAKRAPRAAAPPAAAAPAPAKRAARAAAPAAAAASAKKAAKRSTAAAPSSPAKRTAARKRTG